MVSEAFRRVLMVNKSLDLWKLPGRGGIPDVAGWTSELHGVVPGSDLVLESGVAESRAIFSRRNDLLRP